MEFNVWVHKIYDCGTGNRFKCEIMRETNFTYSLHSIFGGLPDRTNNLPRSTLRRQRASIQNILLSSRRFFRSPPVVVAGMDDLMQNVQTRLKQWETSTMTIIIILELVIAEPNQIQQIVAHYKASEISVRSPTVIIYTRSTTKTGQTRCV